MSKKVTLIFLGVMIVVAGVLFYILFPVTTTAPTIPENQKTISFSVFFAQKNVSANDCSATLPVTRTIPYTKDVAQASLNQLFTGPTADELKRGYSSAFTASSSPLIRIFIKDSVAYIDLQDIRKTQSHISTSCGSSAFIAQVENTLTQFSNIQKIIFAIQENPQTFYEWTQIGCTPDNQYCNPTPFFIASKNSTSWVTRVNTQKTFSFSYPAVFKKHQTTITLPASSTPYSAQEFTYTVNQRHCALSGVCTPATRNMVITTATIPLPYETIQTLFTTIQQPERIQINTYTGISSSMGAEGEGMVYYAFPLSGSSTLIFARSYIDESIISIYKSTPLFIPYEDQRELTQEILSTLKIY